MPNPENLKPVKKGEVRNPNGRPVGSRSRSTIMRYWLDAIENSKNPITGMTEAMTQADIITLALVRKARQGDVFAARELFDSAFGKNADVLIDQSGPKKMVMVVTQGDIDPPEPTE
jgi:hypothetical protein